MKSATALAFIALLGCSSAAILQPGVSTEGDVRRAMGAPALEFSLADGARQFAFPQGPLGTQTYMVVVGGDGKVGRVEQVLTDNQFGRIITGETTVEEVRRLIGPPWRTVRFENLQQDAWDYRFRDNWGYLADFSVMVDDRGVVVNKVTVRIEGGRERGK